MISDLIGNAVISAMANCGCHVDMHEKRESQLSNDPIRKVVISTYWIYTNWKLEEIIFNDFNNYKIYCPFLWSILRTACYCELISFPVCLERYFQQASMFCLYSWFIHQSQCDLKKRKKTLKLHPDPKAAVYYTRKLKICLWYHRKIFFLRL